MITILCHYINQSHSLSMLAHQTAPFLPPISPNPTFDFLTFTSYIKSQPNSYSYNKKRMAIDESCTKPGAIPFKWEIKPGVPKQQHVQQQQHKKPQSPPELPKPRDYNHRKISPLPTPPSVSPQKLRPPPSRSPFVPPMEPRTRSFRSSSRTRSERWRFDRPASFVRPEVVAPGCFLSSFLKRKSVKTKLQKPGPESEPDYSSDLEVLSRWSVSSRRSLSPFRNSPMSSSFSSYQSSPRPMSDAEWAGFGLFWRSLSLAYRL